MSGLRHILAMNVKRERERRGWTQQELSERVNDSDGFGQQAISQIERGVRFPRETALQELADALGVTVAQLLSEAGSAQVDGLPLDLASAHQALDRLYRHAGPLVWAGISGHLQASASALHAAEADRPVLERRPGRRPIAWDRAPGTRQDDK